MTSAQAAGILGDAAKFNMSNVLEAQAKRRLLNEVNRMIDAAPMGEMDATLSEIWGWIQ